MTLSSQMIIVLWTIKRDIVDGEGKIFWKNCILRDNSVPKSTHRTQSIRTNFFFGSYIVHCKRDKVQSSKLYLLLFPHIITDLQSTPCCLMYITIISRVWKVKLSLSTSTYNVGEYILRILIDYI